MTVYFIMSVASAGVSERDLVGFPDDNLLRFEVLPKLIHPKDCQSLIRAARLSYMHDERVAMRYQVILRYVRLELKNEHFVPSTKNVYGCFYDARPIVTFGYYHDSLFASNDARVFIRDLPVEWIADEALFQTVAENADSAAQAAARQGHVHLNGMRVNTLIHLQRVFSAALIAYVTADNPWILNENRGKKFRDSIISHLRGTRSYPVLCGWAYENICKAFLCMVDKHERLCHFEEGRWCQYSTSKANTLLDLFGWTEDVNSWIRFNVIEFTKRNDLSVVRSLHATLMHCSSDALVSDWLEPMMRGMQKSVGSWTALLRITLDTAPELRPSVARWMLLRLIPTFRKRDSRVRATLIVYNTYFRLLHQNRTGRSPSLQASSVCSSFYHAVFTEKYARRVSNENIHNVTGCKDATTFTDPDFPLVRKDTKDEANDEANDDVMLGGLILHAMYFRGPFMDGKDDQRVKQAANEFVRCIEDKMNNVRMYAIALFLVFQNVRGTNDNKHTMLSVQDFLRMTSTSRSRSREQQGQRKKEAIELLTRTLLELTTKYVV